jgi:tetratricopeptide (TPR) repeat protein
MPDETLKEIAQAAVDDFFGNRLNTEEHGFAVQIVQEIKSSVEKNLPVEQWRNHVTDFEQSLQAKLNQAQTASQRSALRFACLWLQQIAGETIEQVYNKLPEQLAYYKRGIEQAEQILAQGETAASVREQVLRLCDKAGEAYYTQNNLPQAIDTYLKGLPHAEAFLTAGETASGVREWVLKLYLNAGYAYELQGNLPQAIDTYLKGLSHAEDFLTAGKTASGVREWVLSLYSNAGVAYRKQGKFQQAIDTYLKGLSQAEDFLTAGETASGVREWVLSLYFNAGVTYYEQGKLPQAIDTYLKGLSHAEDFLTAGETASGVRERVLRLYEGCSSSYYSSGQTHAVILLLPMKGLWSWVALAQVEPNAREKMLRNWQLYLDIAPSFRHVTTAFQTSLRTFVLNWHSPKRPHRHFGFVDTATLLTLSEGLYALTQAQQNEPLDKAYKHLTALVNSEYIQNLQQLDSQQQQYLEQLDRLNQRSWWTRWPLQRWWLTLKIEDYQQRENHQLAQAEQWHQAVEQAHGALVKWLTSAIKSSLDIPSKKSRREDEGLSDLPAIVLGILLASHSVQTGDTVEALLTKWHHEPPWQTAEQLLATLAPSQWQNWANEHRPVLYKWVDSLVKRNDTVRRRLKIVWAVQNNPQPKLQTWLRELDSSGAKAEALDSSAKVLDNVKAAWQSAQAVAEPLARIFTALADPEFLGDLFAKERQPTDTAYQQALAAVVLGDVESQIERVVDDWLKQQIAEHTAHNELLKPVTSFEDCVEQINSLKYCFDRIITLIRQQHHQPIEQVVHGWAQACLKELEIPLKPPVSIPKQQTITLVWERLERARVGLNSLTLHLPDDWEDSLGEQLWKDLGQSIRWLTEGDQPAAQEMWLPLATWINKIGGWLSKPLTAKQCQDHLGAKEALLQPFFDPTHQRLRVLWLDHQHLELRELPEACARQSYWTSADGLMKQWAYGLNLLRTEEKHEDWEKLLQKVWEQVMQSAPVTQLANTLNHWATQQQLEQLTVIFPAPLGQLPWETLEPLEELLVREVSLAHWFKHTTAQHAANPAHPQEAWWVVCGPSGDAKCIPQEAQWVANYYNTTPEAPCTSVFKALSQLANTSHAHLVTHGQFDENSPKKQSLKPRLRSRFTLMGNNRHPNLGPTHHAFGL